MFHPSAVNSISSSPRVRQKLLEKRVSPPNQRRYRANRTDQAASLLAASKAFGAVEHIAGRREEGKTRRKGNKQQRTAAKAPASTLLQPSSASEAAAADALLTSRHGASRGKGATVARWRARLNTKGRKTLYSQSSSRQARWARWPRTPVDGTC